MERIRLLDYLGYDFAIQLAKYFKSQKENKNTERKPKADRWESDPST